MMTTLKKHKGILLVSVLVCLLAVAGYFYVDSLAYKTCYVEAGVTVTPQDFLKKPDASAVFTDKSAKILSDVPGEYRVYVKSGLFTHECTLHIQDTIAPVGETVPLTVYYPEQPAATDFVTGFSDATKVTVGYQQEPDYNRFTEQEVAIVLRDLGGNETVLKTELLICPVVPLLTVEAGEKAPVGKDFLLIDGHARLLTIVEGTTTLGNYPVEVEVDGNSYPSVVEIVDTTAPKAQVCDLTGFTMMPRGPEEFVVSAEDATELSISFEEEPDFSKAGEQNIGIVFTDKGGNETTLQALLTLEADEEPPVIKGALDINYVMGSTIAYRKNVTVTDNSGAELELVIDNSQVNLEQEGVYPVTYSATDHAGNTTTITVKVAVHPQSYDLDEIYAKADEVLAKIITEDMSGYEKVSAIYYYMRRNMAYVNTSDKTDWVKAAYEGLFLRQGDCFVYANTTKVLLDRAGITNMDIAKIPARTSHYWNLVDIGDGWYHLDTTPRKDHPTILYWTDAELMEYSAIHGNSHNYDHDIYPQVN